MITPASKPLKKRPQRIPLWPFYIKTGIASLEATTYDIKSWLSKELRKIGNLRYAYAIMDKNNRRNFFGLSNYPAQWAETYTKNHYQYIEPVRNMALNTISPFIWIKKNSIRHGVEKKNLDTAKDFNITNGYTLVVHDASNNLATLSIAHDNADKREIENHLICNSEKLQPLLIDTHTKLDNRYKEESNIIGQRHENTNKSLSLRENEILYWASMGKSYLEISSILSVSISTIKFHMGNAVKKLGAYNVKQAIIIFMKKSN